MKKFIFTLLALAFFSILSGQTRFDWEEKVAPTLLEKTSNGQSLPFIVVLSAQADISLAKRLNTKEEKGIYIFNVLQSKSKETQEGLISFLNQHNFPHQTLFIINAIKTEGTQQLIRDLAQRFDVAKILDDETITHSEPINWSNDDDHSRQTIEWGIDMINADDVWAMGYRGQGVSVGGEDTGYEWTHPALKKQYRGYDQETDSVDHNYNWHDAIHTISPLNIDSINPCGLNSPVPCDDHGHGTHTMGTMIGSDGGNEIGVAPEARWCGCRNMERGWGSPFTYLECFQWFLAPTDLNNENPDPKKSPHVINNSWSCPLMEGCNSSNWEVMNQVINILKLSGIVVVVSVGNNGSECSSAFNPPGRFEGSLSVGATAINDTIAGFSSRGPVVADSSFRLKPNVSAPGVSVRSAVPGGSYGFSSGTSMAGPHVAGLVALIISANPDLAGKVDIIEDIIEQTAVPKTTDQTCGDIPGSQVPNNTYGFGRIDALAAVEAALALIPVSTDDEQNFRSIKLYPNPIYDQLTLEFPQATGEVTISFFDTNGRIFFSKQLNADNDELLIVDFNNLPSGIYFYRIASGNFAQQGKVIKN